MMETVVGPFPPSIRLTKLRGGKVSGFDSYRFITKQLAAKPFKAMAMAIALVALV